MPKRGKTVESEGEAQQEVVLPPQEESHEHYLTLFEGFFEKLTRWREFIGVPDTISAFQTEEGFVVRQHSSKAKEDPPDKVFQFSYRLDERPQTNFHHATFLMRTGPAGRGLLTDPEGNIVDFVSIETNKRIGMKRTPEKGQEIRQLNMLMKYAQRHEEIEDQYKGRTHKLRNGRMEITPTQGAGLLPEAHQVHLFNAIDALIRRSQAVYKQPGRRATEQQAPRPLPALRRGRMAGH